METPTRFDLSSAQAGWRRELAAQPHLAPDDRRELETHLSDVIAELCERGLNDEESFWLARRRVGQPQRIAEEYASEDPAKVWRERACWLAIGLLAMRLWSGLPAVLLEMLREKFMIFYMRNFFIPEWVLFYLPFLRTNSGDFLRNQVFTELYRFLPLALVVVLFARGRMGRLHSAGQFIFRSRRNLIITAVVLFALYYPLMVLVSWNHPGQIQGRPWPHWTAFLIQNATANALISALLLGLVVWLMPVERTVAKNA